MNLCEDSRLCPEWFGCIFSDVAKWATILTERGQKLGLSGKGGFSLVGIGQWNAFILKRII